VKHRHNLVALHAWLSEEHGYASIASARRPLSSELAPLVDRRGYNGDSALEVAYRAHDSKRFAEAARLYREILVNHPIEPEAILAARQLDNLRECDTGLQVGVSESLGESSMRDAGRS
jgi:hypothetical protein